MYCSTCGKQMPDGAKFCPECGTAAPTMNGNTKRMTVYEGTIHKCPKCGADIGAFKASCPACGYEFRNVEPAQNTQELAAKIEALHRKAIKSNSILGGDKDLLYQQIADTIKTFPIANTREDILSFFALASSSISMSALSTSLRSLAQIQRPSIERKVILAEAWIGKMEQVYLSALATLPEEDLSDIKEFYNKKVEEIKSARRHAKFGDFMYYGMLFLALGFSFLILYGFYSILK